MIPLPRRDRARRYAAALVVTGGLLAVPQSSHAYCRTTTSPVPANYSPASGCYNAGLFLYWKGACIGYSVNSAASQSISLENATSVVDAAFETWNGAVCPGSGSAVGATTSNLGPVSCAEVRYNPTGPNQNLVVFRDDRWPYSDPNNTLGLTTVTFNADTGEIYDADMEINASGRNLSTSDVVPTNGFDLLSVVTHEAGHFLGLAHATASTSTMFASYRPGSTALRSPRARRRRGRLRDLSGRVAAQGVDTGRPQRRAGCDRVRSDPSPRFRLDVRRQPRARRRQGRRMLGVALARRIPRSVSRSRGPRRRARHDGRPPPPAHVGNCGLGTIHLRVGSHRGCGPHLGKHGVSCLRRPGSACAPYTSAP
jgi:hypothetical protein